MTRETSNKIANMGIFCAFVVVLYHVPLYEGEWIGVKTALYAKLAGRMAVPCFFAISGYFLAGHFNEPGWYACAVRKRFRTLYLPMVLWSLLYFFYSRYLVSFLLDARYGNLVLNSSHVSVPTWIDFAHIFGLHPFHQPFLGVLWFVRTLFMLVLVSPLLRKIAAPAGVLALWLALGIFTPDYDAIPWNRTVFTFNRGAFPILSAPYFLLGMTLRLKNADLIRPRWQGFAALVLAMILLVASNHASGVASTRIRWLGIPVLIYGTWTLCPAKRAPDILVKAAFPVYVMHWFVLDILKLIAPHLKSLGSFRFHVFGASAFATSLLFAFLLRKLFPRLSAVLFGGR